MMPLSFLPATYHPLLRRAAVLAGVSLGLALALVAYLFGVGDNFFTRLFGAFFVFFWLLAATFLGAVPFVNWAAARWFDKGWAKTPVPAANRRPRPAAPPAGPAPRRQTSRPQNS